jgi:hypothetical protein
MCFRAAGACTKDNTGLMKVLREKRISSTGVTSSVTRRGEYHENNRSNFVDLDFFWIFPDRLGAAYQIAGAFALIKACRLEITENLDFGLGKSIVISGGYDSSYSNISGRTTVKGTFKVRSGNVRVRNVAIR